MTVDALRSSPTPCNASMRRRRPKWADILDGSHESDSSEGEEWLSMLPPAMDDSYREAPVATLEDSRSGLNLRLSRAASLFPDVEGHDQAPEDTDFAPSDFEFLFRVLEPQTAACKVSEDYDFEPVLRVREDSSPLNANAPEFIPTLSHGCPLIGFCQMIPEDVSAANSIGDLTERSAANKWPRTPGRRRRRAATSSTCSVGAETPSSQRSSTPRAEKEFGFEKPSRCSAGSSPQLQAAAAQSGTKKQAARKRRVRESALKSPAMKRTRSEEREEAPKGHTEMPELSQEDWEHRCATRQRAIAFGTATPEYKRYVEMRASGDPGVDSLVIPDPMDRSISKRQWKYIVQQWRNALKRLCGSPTDGGSTVDGGETGSTVSGDEGRSSITATDEADGISTSTTYNDDGIST